MTDLIARTAQLIDVPSPSLGEAELADLVEAELRRLPWLDVTRHGDNVVARTSLGRAQRLVLAGHLDTVPANGNDVAVVDDGVVRGLGASDMKGGLAVYLELARAVPAPTCDVTYVFYVAEEIAGEHNGLRALFAVDPELVTGDAAVLGEPTDGWIEAGCQGTVRLELTLAGERAHTARPWMGRNAIHRAGPILVDIAGLAPREPEIAGCTYRETIQVVRVEGGVAGNVVPDRVVLTVNLRVAPDRTLEEGIQAFRDLVAPHLESGDEMEVVDASPPAPPSIDHPLLEPLAAGGVPTRAKLGWTDVARFAEHGIPAINYGPGDATLAHTADEWVSGDKLDEVFGRLKELLEADRASAD